MKDLIDYQPPFQLTGSGNTIASKERRKESQKFVAHAHFLKGKQSYVETCEYCRGVEKPPYTPEEREARRKLKQKYIQEYRVRMAKQGHGSNPVFESADEQALRHLQSIQREEV